MKDPPIESASLNGLRLKVNRFFASILRSDSWPPDTYINYLIPRENCKVVFCRPHRAIPGVSTRVLPCKEALQAALYDNHTCIRNFCELCMTVITVPEKFVTAVHLCHNSRGTGTTSYSRAPP